MKLKRLSITSFRNIEQSDLLPGEGFNVFHGKNAQGKTNLLETIFLLGTMKSFRNSKNGDLIRWGEHFSLIRGVAEREGISREISLLIEPEGKKARIDSKSLARMTDFFGNLNVVVFSPEELSMVKGQPEQRRRFLDRAVFSGDTGYLAVHQEYGRILKNRNALLRSGHRDGLDIWTERLIDAAARLAAKRVEWLEGVAELLPSFYARIAGGREPATIAYRPCFSGKGSEGYRERLAEALKKGSEEEFRRGVTIAGPHRDDLDFSVEGRIIKHHGSQGQQRTFVLALKMAEIELLQRRFLVPPILLLDDITSELDAERNANLMDFLKSGEMQVFITTTSLDNLKLNGMENYRAFRVDDGKILQ